MMDADIAIDLWTRKKLSMQEVLQATGHKKISELFVAYLDFHEEADMASARPSADDDMRRELEDLAWGLYQPLLAEERGYLDQIVEVLRKRKRQQFQEFAAVFSSKRPSMHNVVPLR
ncbi:hypothetical protein ABIA16_003590 [Sinorhizobium fredii]